MRPDQNLYIYVVLLLGLLLIGTGGYVAIAGWSLLAAFYMMVISLSTTLIGAGVILITLGELAAVECLEKVALSRGANV